MASIGIEILAILYSFNFYIVPFVAMGAVVYLMKMWTCPMITRNPCELAILFGPDRAQVYKVTRRLAPFFTTKDGNYWFGAGKTVAVTQPSKNIKAAKKGLFGGRRGKQGPAPTVASREDHEAFKPAPVPKNKLHVFVEGVNQPVDQLDRMETKLADLTVHYRPLKQIKRQTVRFPKVSLAFERNWALIVKNEGYELRPTREKQPHKVNFFVRVGLYIENKAENAKSVAESENTSASDLLSVTIQTVKEKVGDTEQNANFSAAFARNILRQVRWMERNWIGLLTGASNMLPLLIMAGAAMAVVVIFLMFPQGPGAIGPRPAG